MGARNFIYYEQAPEGGRETILEYRTKKNGAKQRTSIMERVADESTVEGGTLGVKRTWFSKVCQIEKDYLMICFGSYFLLTFEILNLKKRRIVNLTSLDIF